MKPRSQQRKKSGQAKSHSNSRETVSTPIINIKHAKASSPDYLHDHNPVINPNSKKIQKISKNSQNQDLRDDEKRDRRSDNLSEHVIPSLEMREKIEEKSFASLCEMNEAVKEIIEKDGFRKDKSKVSEGSVDKAQESTIRLKKITDNFFNSIKSSRSILEKSSFQEESEISICSEDEREEERKLAEERELKRMKMREEEEKAAEERRSNKTAHTKSAKWLEGYEVVKIIAKGLHGLVLKIRDTRGDLKIVKVYSKNDNEAYLNEATLLSFLSIRAVYKKGGVGLWDIVEGSDFYGIILQAGVATLTDFRNYLRDTKRELTDNVLIDVFSAIYKEYKTILAQSFVHRDIKLDNIILHAKSLSLELIDFSLAICIEPLDGSIKCAGTRGYVSANLIAESGRYSKKSLIKGDLYAIGITILQLAIPDYCLNRSCLKKEEFKEILETIRHKYPKLFYILYLLLHGDVKGCYMLEILSRVLDERVLDEINEPGNFEGLMREIRILDILAQDSSYRADNQERCGGHNSSLTSHYQEFMLYLSNDSHTLSKKPHFFRHSNTENPESLGDQLFIDGINSLNEHGAIRSLENLDLACKWYEKAGNKAKELHCYEILAKYFFHQPKFFDRCETIIQQFNENQFIFCHPLLYNTLGVQFYLKDELDKAEDLFQKGLYLLEDQPNKLAELLLLNNYGCFLSKARNDLEKSTSIFEKIGSLMKEKFYNYADYIMEQWATISFESNQITKSVQQVKINKEERLSELVLTIKKLTSHKTKCHEQERLIFLVFMNYCYSHADDLNRLLKNDNHTSLSKKLQDFICDFNNSRSAKIKLADYFEVFNSFAQFQKILADEDEACLNSPQLLKFVNEAKLYLQKKEQLYPLFRKTGIKLLFKEIKETKLFFTMMGFSAESKPQTENVISSKLLNLPKNIISSVEIVKKDPSALKEYLPEDLKEYFDERFQEKFREWGIKLPIDSDGNALKDAEFINYLKFETFTPVGNSLNYFRLLAEVLYRSRFFESIENLSITLFGGTRMSTDEFFYVILCFSIKLVSLLSLELLFIYSDPRDFEMQEISDILKQQNRLQSLKMIFQYSFMTQVGLNVLTKNALAELKELERLDLSFILCPHLTNDSVYTLCSTISKLPSLKNITLSFFACGRVDPRKNEDLKSLFQELPRSQLEISINPIYVIEEL